MWVIKVFSGDRRRPIVDKIPAICARRASASALGTGDDRTSHPLMPTPGLCRVECWLPGDPR